ncbi:MAG: tetratricopeptide repeat protein [Chloroflexota bacterium]
MDSQQTFTPHGAPIRNSKLLPVQAPKRAIGRNRELGVMHNTLKIGASIFLSGASGIGKTALAAVLATAYTTSTPGGVLWFDVLEDDFDLLVARVGRAYGVNTRTTPGADPAANIKTVKDLLSKNKPLIVLDGLVEIGAARDFVRMCASAVPVIITNENTGAGPWTPLELGPLSAVDSQALFKQAAELENDLSYDDDIEGLCKFLGGVPLAIEMAARQVVTDDVTPAELLVTLPSSTGQDGPLLMTAIVFKRLTPAVQGVLLLLSAMFTPTTTAELISDLTDIPPASVIPQMRQLVTRSLVRESVVYGQFAYTLHEIIQDYTRNWLQQYQRLQGTEIRALRAVLKYTDRHAHDTHTHHDRLAAEIENIIGAAAFATDIGQGGALRQLVQALTQKSGDFITQRGFQPEMAQLTKLVTLLSSPTTDATQVAMPAASIAETQGSQAVKADTTRQSAAQSSQPAVIDEPVVTNQDTPTPGHTAVLQPKPFPPESNDDTQITQVTPAEPYTALYETQPSAPAASIDTTQMSKPDLVADDPSDLSDPSQPVVLAVPVETSVDTLDESLILSSPVMSNASVLDAMDEPAEAIQSVTPSIIEPLRTAEDTDIPTEHSLPSIQSQLEEARSAGDTSTQAHLLHVLGQYYVTQGDTTQALFYHRQALDQYEKLDDRDGMLATLETLATITAQADDAENTLVYATRGANLAQSLGDQLRLGRLQTRLGDVRMALDDTPTAIQTYAQAAESLRAAEDWFSVGVVMSKLGNAYLEEKQYREAILMLEQALAIFNRENRSDYASRVLGSFGAARKGLQQWDSARNYYEQALKLARQNSDRSGEAAYLNSLGLIYNRLNQRDQAIIHYRQALNIAYEANATDLQADAAFELGRMLTENMSTLQTGLQLLKAANTLLPRDETRQLINRATKRVDRAIHAGETLPAAESPRDYAAGAYSLAGD